LDNISVVDPDKVSLKCFKGVKTYTYKLMEALRCSGR